MSQLNDAVEAVRAKIVRHGSQAINEQNTKTSLIQPILRALGWDVEDLDEVQMEYRRRSSDKPVDYALLVVRAPKLFVEAKPLGESLDDSKWANQIMGYATVAGVKWVAITNGDEYRIYNAHAPVPVEEKLFRSISIKADAVAAAETLGLLSKDRITENEIDLLWNAQFVDRQVRAAIESLFATENDVDAALLRLVAKRCKSLSRKDIRDSLRRARIGFDFPIEHAVIVTKSMTRKSAGQGVKRVRQSRPALNRGPRPARGRRQNLVYLEDLIQRGIVKPPLRLFKEYKGRHLEAVVQADGRVAFDGQVYDTPSTAAEFARSTVTGRRMQTNGWSFWLCKTTDGKTVELDSFRRAYLKCR